LEHLAELPPFELWFHNIVVEDMAAGVEVVEDIISLNSPPSRVATAYYSMYAFGSHL
jgi:hypothetical protein